MDEISDDMLRAKINALLDMPMKDCHGQTYRQWLLSDLVAQKIPADQKPSLLVNAIETFTVRWPVNNLRRNWLFDKKNEEYPESIALVIAGNIAHEMNNAPEYLVKTNLPDGISRNIRPADHKINR